MKWNKTYHQQQGIQSRTGVQTQDGSQLLAKRRKVCSLFVTSVKVDSWHTTQPYLKCCGADSPEDWSKSDVFRLYSLGLITENKINNTRKNPVPDSCCLQEEQYCGLKSTSKIYEKGCLESLEGSLEAKVCHDKLYYT